MTAKAYTEKQTRPLPPHLAEVALIDAHTSSAVGGMSVSWWHDEVRAGRAPAPVIRQPRCTRWRLADVRAYWERRALEAANDAAAAERLIARNKEASQAARAKRHATATAAQR